MSLKAFHIVFICVSTLLAFGFSVWSYREYAASADSGHLIVTVLSAVVGVGLIAYGGWFLRKLKKLNAA